jgi:hypothetical protein
MDYKYPRQKINGIWLIIAGLAMFLLLIKYQDYPNVWPFAIVYIIGMIWQLSPKTRKRLAVGPGTKGQKKWSNFSIVLLSLLVVISVFINQGNVRMAWLYVLLAVGFHFLTFIPVHGKMMIFLSLCLMINALIGLSNNQINLDIFFITDGLIKLVFGFIFIKISPTNF